MKNADRKASLPGLEYNLTIPVNKYKRRPGLVRLPVRKEGGKGVQSPIIGGLLAFLVGCGVAYVNYRINLYTLRKRPNLLATLSGVRQFLNVACLAAAYILGKTLPWGRVPLLVGAAVGLTVPSVLLSLRLAKKNDALAEPSPDESASKGEDRHG